MLVHPDGTQEPLAIGLPGDRELDMKRLDARVEPARAALFGPSELESRPQLVKGYIGPGALGERHGVRYLLDPRVVEGSAWVTGADSSGRHVLDLVVGRDFESDGMIDVAEVRIGDPCPDCGVGLEVRRGIEIGHIFQLGRKYAEALGLDVLGPDGHRVVVTMGSYGIGVSRAVAAIAESTLDELGLCWPREVAPADVHVVAAGKDSSVLSFSEGLAGRLVAAGRRVLFDDRAGVSPAVKFTDAELIGVPTVVVVGRGLEHGTVEVRDRRTGTVDLIAADAAAHHLVEISTASA